MDNVRFLAPRRIEAAAALIKRNLAELRRIRAHWNLDAPPPRNPGLDDFLARMLDLHAQLESEVFRADARDILGMVDAPLFETLLDSLEDATQLIELLHWLGALAPANDRTAHQSRH